MDNSVEDGIINLIRINHLLLISGAGQGGLPLSTELLDLLLVVLLRVVVLARAHPVLPHRQVGRVHSGTVVLGLTSLTDVHPAALLFTEVQTSGVRKEQQGQDSTSKTEPRHNKELHLGAGVGTDDGNDERTELTGSGRDTVGSTTNGGGEDLGSDQESDTVRTELVKEGGEEVHRLELVDVLGHDVVVVAEGGDHKADEAGNEANDLHPLAAVQLVVDKPHGHVVATHLNSNVGQVVKPSDHGARGVGVDNADKVARVKLVSVEENIVGEPATSGSENSRAEVLEGKLQGLHIIASHGGLLLLSIQLLARRVHVVSTVVHKPESKDGGDSKRNAVGPLGGGVGDSASITIAVVENKQQENQNDLVQELTPSLHKEGTNHRAATVQAVLAGDDLAGRVTLLHTNGGGHRVLTTNTEAVDKEGNGVADDPAVEGQTPRGSEHDKTEGHDDSILNETKTTANPVLCD